MKLVRKPIVAAGVARPPRAWFEMPEPSHVQALRVDDDGRVYGHAAAWGSCHIGYAGVCKEPPRSMSGYAHFHRGYVVCDDGSEVEVGPVTMDKPHAALRDSAEKASAHYDDTRSVVAHVRASDGAHGIWVCGALCPGVPDDRVARLRGVGSLSGDWRPLGRSLEAVGFLAIPVAGFNIPREQALVAAGADGPEILALVAAGVVQPPDLSAQRAALLLDSRLDDLVG